MAHPTLGTFFQWEGTKEAPEQHTTLLFLAPVSVWQVYEFKIFSHSDANPSAFIVSMDFIIIMIILNIVIVDLLDLVYLLSFPHIGIHINHFLEQIYKMSGEARKNEKQLKPSHSKIHWNFVALRLLYAHKISRKMILVPNTIDYDVKQRYERHKKKTKRDCSRWNYDG